jgi:hypothetical protein
VEVVNLGANERTVGTRILGNYFADGLDQAVSIGNGGNADESGTNNVIDSTLISGNIVVRHAGVGMMLVGGHTNATGCAIVNTRIVNNLITNPLAGRGIVIRPGAEGGSLSRVEGTRLVNNTIVNSPGSAASIEDNAGGTGNTVSDLLVKNTLMWGNGGDVSNNITPSQVSGSLFSQLRIGYTGSNGNISADPLFVDAANGDYHLRNGSPSIQAGTTIEAPTTDIECRPRTGKPDIGAFQFGSPAVCALPKPFW